MRVQDKVAIITGGASGIGAAAARLLAREGARVAILDIDRKGAERVAHASRGEAHACDVSDEEQVRAACGAIAARHGRIDVLLANAGVAVRRTVGDEEVAAWERVMATNVRGAFLCAKHSIPHMPPGASIVITSSAVGITGVRNRAVYSAAKGALVALTRNMALDYAAHPIRVNCICPGFVRTPLVEGILSSDPRRAEAIRSMHPLGRLGTPEDIANAVLFLISEEAAWITGAVLAVDGGFSAGHQHEV
jgi:NAD(P)-dependent dehydrogenase (short-subunit alcohol dehydrogenase family)